MRTTDAYHKRVEWSDEYGVYLGKCPDLITGIHGDDPVKVYAELMEMLTSGGKSLRTCSNEPTGTAPLPIDPLP